MELEDALFETPEKDRVDGGVGAQVTQEADFYFDNLIEHAVMDEPDDDVIIVDAAPAPAQPDPSLMEESAEPAEAAAFVIPPLVVRRYLHGNASHCNVGELLTGVESSILQLHALTCLKRISTNE